MLTPLSQHLDFKKDEYKIKGCGIACLGMFLGSDVNLDELFQRGVDTGAYAPGIGWRHAELAQLGHRFGFLRSQNYDLAALSDIEARRELEDALGEGPVIASVHTRYNPSQSEGHLVVLLSLTNETAEVMDPAAIQREAIRQHISKEQFLASWKKRFIVIRS